MEPGNKDMLSSNASVAHSDDDGRHEKLLGNVTGSPQLIVKDEVIYFLNFTVFLSLCGSMAVLGVMSNVANIVVFYRLGLKDSMGVCLFVLSCNDFVLSCLIAFDRVFYAWSVFDTGDGVDPLAVSHISISFYADSLFLCSGWILSFLSVERCVCVVLPFKVRQIFTRNRSIAVIVVIYVVVVATTLLPVVATQWLAWAVGRGVNGTMVSWRMVIVVSEDRHLVEEIDAVLSTTLIPVPSLVITFASVLWMIYGLVTSSKIRHTLTSGKAEATDRGGGGGGGGEKQEHRLTDKTRKLVQVVLILAIIFLVCSVPRIIGKSVRVIFPQGAQERNVNNLIWQFARFTSTFNAFINIIVYLKINSSYRDKFRELFKRSSD